ncbi:hypothetical protein ANN_11718 [Periplaneta americana]|uniref:Uncharacterized protein n=1 Tax=Periplaneta americana TaxID=6978 RepID=A0ABQ8T7B4_PERAM|nr:hypothetical protein ANN_11718 [Periplaneta americana]
MVLDPTICFERDTNQALQINDDKRAKYVPRLPYLSEKYGISLYNWDVAGLLFGARGCLPKFTCNILKSFKIPFYEVQKIDMLDVNPVTRLAPVSPVQPIILHFSDGGHSDGMTCHFDALYEKTQVSNFLFVKLGFDVTPEIKAHWSQIRRTRWPFDRTSSPDPVPREVSVKRLSHVNPKVWRGPILLEEGGDGSIRFGYQGYYRIFQHAHVPCDGLVPAFRQHTHRTGVCDQDHLQSYDGAIASCRNVGDLWATLYIEIALT